MAKLKKAVGTGKSLLNRIAGVSFMGVGLSWKAPELERKVIRDLITQLEDRRALYTNNEREGGSYVSQSVIRIREMLTEALIRLDEQSPAVTPIRMMRAACRQFLETPPGSKYERFHSLEHAAEFYSELGKLRSIFGQNLAVLSVLYDLKLEAELASILPPEPDESEVEEDKRLRKSVLGR
jgi:hypothetical protein